MGFNLRPHYHSGHHLSHEHTSYAGLFFVTLLAGVILLLASASAHAIVLTAPPGSGNLSAGESIGLSSTVVGNPPTTAANIERPTDGQHFTQIPITVDGTCGAGNFIQIYSNDNFMGSTVCGDNGRFSLLIDLFDGANRLVAKVSDAANQPGPDSRAVTVYYDPIRPTSANGAALTEQLRLHADQAFLTTFPDQAITWTFTVTGGNPPYAIDVAWGDGTEDLFSVAKPGEFKVKHTYTKAGRFNVVVKAVDASRNQAFLQVVTIVNGQPVAAVPAQPIDYGRLGVLWPLYLLLILMLTSFWLGEKYKVYRLRQKGLLASG